MKRNKTSLKKALKAAQANEWQQRAAFILFHVNGIDNALEYVSGLNYTKAKPVQRNFW